MVFNGEIFWVVHHSANLPGTFRSKNYMRLPVENWLFWKTASFEKVALVKEYSCEKVDYSKSSILTVIGKYINKINFVCGATLSNNRYTRKNSYLHFCCMELVSSSLNYQLINRKWAVERNCGFEIVPLLKKYVLKSSYSEKVVLQKVGYAEYCFSEKVASSKK